MSKESKTARASAVRAPKEEKPAVTQAQAIQEIRNLRAGRLAVLNTAYIDHLLVAHDLYATTIDNANRQADAILADLEIAKADRIRLTNKLIGYENELKTCLALINEHMTVQRTDLEDALRNLLQAYISMRDVFRAQEAEDEAIRQHVKNGPAAAAYDSLLNLALPAGQPIAEVKP